MVVYVLTVLPCMQLAIYSPADRLQPHRYKADESYQVGQTGMTPVACYLDTESIVSLAKEHGVDVIHPGYGFLAENAGFARRCETEGIAFVGPRPETIEVTSSGLTCSADSATYFLRQHAHYLAWPASSYVS